MLINLRYNTEFDIYDDFKYGLTPDDLLLEAWERMTFGGLKAPVDSLQDIQGYVLRTHILDVYPWIEWRLRAIR